MSSNNSTPILIPIKSIDFDNFIEKFKKEMDIYFNKINKSKKKEEMINHNKNIIKNIIKNKIYSKKQIKDIQILYEILDKREILDEVVNKRNEMYINKLHKNKNKIKISECNTYKIDKKNIISSRKWDNRSYDLVSKKGKKYFCKNISLFHKRYDSSYKVLNLLETKGLEDKIKYFNKLNKLSFIPKIIELIIIKKKNIINEIKIISEYVIGKNLMEYLKKNKLKKTDKDKLKKQIHDKLNKIYKLGIFVADPYRSIIIDNKKNINIISGFYGNIGENNWFINELDNLINHNGKYHYENNEFVNLTYVIINNMLNKNIIKFKNKK